jgi:hypothetical protein|tara:strand:+ start:306 stop:506 length:201 start_codon:yes stop_codon:yes gene_type:complete
MMNEKLKEQIKFAMYKYDINKKDLADMLELSYPTMLLRLKDPDTFKVRELKQLCYMLNQELIVNIK